MTFEENRNPNSVNHLVSPYGHRRTSTQSGSLDVGRGMENSKPAVLYYFDEKETMLSLAGPGFTT